MGLHADKKCEGCGADLRGEAIPEDSLAFYNHGPNGEILDQADYVKVRDQVENETTHYSRVIGIEYAGGYDGVVEWACPDCGRREGRWSGKVLEPGEFEEPFGGKP